MIAQPLATFQKQFWAGLNQFAEPWIRAGVGNPILLPAGTIIVETVGRKTRRKINLPLLAMRVGGLLVLSTVRRNSQWVKNLAARPDVRYWLAGQPHEATALVLTSDQRHIPDGGPSNATCLAQFLQLQSRVSGISFAILISRPRDLRQT